MAHGELTPRELDVVRHLATGLSAKMIGTRLGISPRTVERFIDTARLKRRSRNRVDLIVGLLRDGLLETARSEGIPDPAE